MDEKKVQHILIEILYATINEVEDNESIKEKITPDMFLSVYRLAKRHDLAHVVSNFAYKNKLEIDQDLLARLQREEIISVYRNEQMKYSFGEICGAFDEIGIVDIVNEPVNVVLPATGGIGTIIYILCGLALIIGPLVYGLSLRRRCERRSAR